ncbi:hypothetical protein [Mesorhizobium sp. 131-3-5]|uniref:hypothetical protein n=1 Tax=Mesorhizobium sp. 131-3-5 TaxID=2744520 RepID=UPI0018ECF33F|nr:hypothetical protein [Mesorhizobium sp. 131-3-5]
MGEPLGGSGTMAVFEELESNVRLYSRSCPTPSTRARGSIMLTKEGGKIIVFLSGAGALNYGHNNHEIKAAITEYLASDAVVNGLTCPRQQNWNLWRPQLHHTSGSGV